EALTAAKAASPKAKVVSAPPVSDSWTLSEASKSVAEARSKLQAGLKTEAKAPAKRRSKVPLLLAVIVVVVAAGVFFLTNRGAGIAVGDGAPVTLIYNDTSFTMVNGGDYILNVNDLKFVRGIDGGGDDYNGYRITKKILPGNSCA